MSECRRIEGFSAEDLFKCQTLDVEQLAAVPCVRMKSLLAFRRCSLGSDNLTLKSTCQPFGVARNKTSC
jgi:hypothetical protein